MLKSCRLKNMKIAMHHYQDGRNEGQEIPDGEPAIIRFKVEHNLDPAIDVKRIFQYRAGQPADAETIHYDEIIDGTPIPPR